MSYRGDINLGDTIDLKFTSRKFSTGAPYTLAGSPVISAYPDNSTTQLTAGITLTVDFDAVTGLNNVRVVATGGNGYATATNYDLVITTGTVDSVSVVGEVIGSFSIEKRSALRPTTAGRTLDVSSGGEAGLDWANVGSPTTTVGLSGTTVKTATDVETDTADIQSRLPAALTAGGNIKADALALSGDTVAADNAESFFDGTGYAGTNNVIPTVTLVNTLTTYTGNTPQTGDSYAIVNSGTHGNAAIKGYVDDIGVAGAGLTAVPWNAAWDAEVQSEVDDALVAQNLDHLVKIAVDTNFATTVHLDSVIGQLADNGTTATFDRTTDSLEAVRDRGDAAWTTATGFSTHSAADVWAVGTRVLTGATNITSTGGTITVSSGGVQVYDFTTVAKALLEAEAIDALNAYDPPTNAEMEARTLVASGYATPTNITAGTITTATNVTTVNGLAANVITAASLATDAANEIADAVLGRSVANVEATAAEWSLSTVILASLESSISGTTWTIKGTDGTTTRFTKTVSKTPSDDPIRGVS